ncbi:Hypp7760 [Branchiostoma lanceolatum]|uniref:Hypp7760 protein n=1 Tax=Branchiostoma lanceolatum TaxID=7740 RepID=A0A8K0EFK1_BRALA|nr:Hypp7760 [Branchiostoma lanceolatum]
MSYGVNGKQDGGSLQPQLGRDIATVFPPQSNVDVANLTNGGGSVYHTNVPYHQSGQPRQGGQWNGGYPGQTGHGHPLAPAYPPISHQPVPTNKGVMVQGAGPTIAGRGQYVTQNGRRVQRQRTNDSTPLICCVVCCVGPDCDLDCCDGCDCDF